MRRFLRTIVQLLDGTPAATAPGDRQRQRGQSLVELAFVTPILLIMVAGIVEIGWYANNYINLLEAAKVGARRGPFLNAENAPQNFLLEMTLADQAVIHPQVASAGYAVLPGPDEVGFEVNDIRNRVRGIAEPDDPNTRCENIAVEDFGFYNLVVCTVLDSLDPLSIRTGLRTDIDTPRPWRDDIVVSAFAVQHVNNCPKFGINPNDPKADTQACDREINTPGKTYPTGHQMVVVGRYPRTANECQVDAEAQESRDPFDYIVDGDINTDTIVIGGQAIPVAYELGNPLYDEFTGAFIRFQAWIDPDPESPGMSWTEAQRGFVWTGQHVVDEMAGYSHECRGSEFTIDEVEDLMNLPNFVDNDDPDDVANMQDRLSYLPNQGLVLVEIFWEHELLMGEAFPIFFAAYNLFDELRDEEGGGNVIHVWSAFPAPAAEPNIVYILDGETP